MPSLLVLPEETFTMLQEVGFGLSKLTDVNYMAKNLSVADIVDIHFALQDFPFAFSESLGIKKAATPVDLIALALSNADLDQVMLEDLYNRVNGRIDTCQVRRSADSSQPVHQYQLYAVDENLWVAVQQRLRTESSDPSRLLLSANTGFFDELMAQALHTMSFDRVCSTNLFTYYLGSLRS